MYCKGAGSLVGNTRRYTPMMLSYETTRRLQYPMSTPVSPHDRFFKESFSRPEVAADLFRRALPAEVVDTLDLTTIKPAKGSFVDPKLREHHSDLLFEVTGRDGSPVLIYLLIEHKSYPEWWVALDLLRYAVEIWRDWLKQQANAKVKEVKQLPPLIPLVLYHGTDRWTAPTDVADLVEASAILERYRPHFRHELLDLSKVADETLPAGVVSKVALLALKYIFRPEMYDRVVDIVAALKKLDAAQPGVLEYFRTVLNYLIAAAYALEDERLRQVLSEHFREGDNIMPTIAEKWEQRGELRGVRKGEGLVVERLLRRRFGPLPGWAVERLAGAASEELEQCADRLLDAPDLEAVFREEIGH
ncbi:transposase [Gammaproteobacteria bacterium]